MLFIHQTYTLLSWLLGSYLFGRVNTPTLHGPVQLDDEVTSGLIQVDTVWSTMQAAYYSMLVCSISDARVPRYYKA